MTTPDKIDTGPNGETKAEMLNQFKHRGYWNTPQDPCFIVLNQLSAAQLGILYDKTTEFGITCIGGKTAVESYRKNKGLTIGTKYNLLKAELRAIEESYNTIGASPERTARAREILEILKGEYGSQLTS